MFPRSSWARWAALLATAAAALAASLLVGSADLRVGEVLAVLAGQGEPMARTVVLELRLPRAAAAFGVGGALALAGLLLQAMFRNPLADPYVLGVSGGAAVGAMLAILAGIGALGIQSAAAAGAAIAMILVWLLGRGGGTARLLLTGVVVAAGCGAVVTLLLAMASGDQLRGMVFWLGGDLSGAAAPWLPLAVLLAATSAVAFAGHGLDVLASGELRARSIGLDTERWRPVLFLAAAALTSVAVVSAGTIGFVGLIGPHAARLLLRTADHRRLAPAAALLGGSLVAIADLLARTIAEPRQLPVGGLIALLGAPLFVALLRRAAR
jgi:iron complex transport system permease protein